MASMGDISEGISFPAEEEAVLELWRRTEAFRRSLELSRGKPEFSFYDGPPFATGLPHYGHILAGTIKDTVTRYATQTGHYVSRRFGWDCHGLPIEFEIDKKLGITSRDEVIKMGIDKYNAECRSIVQRYSSEWEEIVTRLGRWIDFKNDYKTMEPWFMESVWWVFKSLWEKNLVYRGFKVMPYSTACSTPLSNFEANLNYHEDTKDPAVVVKFPLVDDPEVALVAWTTTPWTLPSNLSLCVHPELDYVKIRDIKSGSQFILAEARLSQLYPKVGKKGYKGGEFEVVAKMVGKDLEGKHYDPLFRYFYTEYQGTAYRVLCDTYVTADAGTGVVHQAPAFGEDDYRVCLANGVIDRGENIPCPVDASGRFTAEVTDFAGAYVKESDDAICAKLKEQGKLFSKSTIVHSYPFCWRSDTPLIYRAVPSWFVRVEDIKDRLIENNFKTRWVPASVQEKRFHNWIRDARDWAVSRNRFWGTPLPIWASEDGEELVVVGSIKELEELTGTKITDLHRESVDHLTIPSRQGKGDLRRVEEVFDCWFESGSMPYAQIHYPFENKERFEKSYFPADFIAEGLDQTRGWFYTLMVLSTALFDQPAFKNLVVNGLVLAADGKKMSKRLKNYPDPSLVVSRYGADALRLYLIDSPVVRAEPLKFDEKGVNAVLREAMLPWYNSFRFLVQNAQKLEEDTGTEFVPDVHLAAGSSNPMDHWIFAAVQGLIKFVREEMEAYRLYTVVPRLVRFIGQLTNWYIRLNRQRIKGMDGYDEGRTSLAVLYEVLLTMSRLMAPFTPFFSEMLYQRLRLAHPARNDETASSESPGRADSIHHVPIPEYNTEWLDAEAEAQVAAMQAVVILGRTARERRSISLKNPVARITVVVPDEAYKRRVEALRSYIVDELNAVDLDVTTEQSKWCSFGLRCDAQLLGKRLGKAFGGVRKTVMNMPHEQVASWLATPSPRTLKVEAGGQVHELEDEALSVVLDFKGDKKKYEAASSGDGSILVVVDTEQTDSLRAAGLAREVTARVQKLRKHVGLERTDKVDTYIQVLPRTVATMQQAVQDLKARAHSVADLPAGGGIAAAAYRKKVASSKSKETSATNPTEAQAFLSAAIAEHLAKFQATVESDLLPDCPESRPADAVILGVDEAIVGGALLRITLANPIARFPEDDNLLVSAFENDEAQSSAAESAAALRHAARLYDVSVLTARARANDGAIRITVDGRHATLRLNEHIFVDGVAHMQAMPAIQQVWKDAGYADLIRAYSYLLPKEESVRTVSDNLE